MRGVSLGETCGAAVNHSSVSLTPSIPPLMFST
ncbi:hypothetical protein A2U01_0037912, partial [Trifolium medium]|nr:hypothetical protein [Trifolium medium]